jgi:copper chaperone CopZ
MDDAGDRTYSRAPEAKDVLDICRALNEERARYVLIGGFAVILHGFVRTTKDIDLLIDPSVENLQRVKRALAVLPDNAIALVADNDVKNYGVVRVADEVVVDLMASAGTVDYDSAQSDIERITVEGVLIPVAGKKSLMKMKDTPRPSDQIDRSFLAARIAEEQNG